MPYIDKKDRLKLNIFAEYAPLISNAGELNFVVSTLAKGYVNTHGENYQTYNDLIGALEGIKLELYRRKVALYEDKKIEENGDI